MNIEHLYRHDIADIPDWRKISRLAQGEILDRVRKGDESAREEAICSLLPYTLAYATKLQGGSILVMDLVSAGNVAILEYFDRALSKENPCGYLFKCAIGQMKYYKRRYGNAITMPTTGVDTPYEICDIDDCDIDEFIQVSAMTEMQDHSPLYEALATLIPDGRTLLTRLFGLYEEPQENLADIAGGNSTTNAYKAAEKRKWRYFETCLRFIERYHPEYVQQHTSEKAKSLPAYAGIAIPEKVFKKLEQARRLLQERGENVSALKLMKAARVHGQYASAYLYRVKE